MTNLYIRVLYSVQPHELQRLFQTMLDEIAQEFKHYKKEDTVLSFSPGGSITLIFFFTA